MDKIKRYLITGAAGQLGSELLRQLGEEALPKARESLDVTNLDLVRQWLPVLKPDLVIHCASYRSHEELERSWQRQRECWRTNVLATDNLVKTCAEAGIPLLYVSTNRVFGQELNPDRPYIETDPVGPVGYWAQSKVMAEHAVLRIGQEIAADYWKKGFRYWIIRSANLFERPWRAYRNVASSILAAYEKPSGVAIPPHMTSFCYVPHLARSICHIARNQHEVTCGVYHVANEEAGTYFDFALRLGRYSRKKCEPSMGKPDAGPQYTALDTDCFPERAGGPRLPNWQDAVDEYGYELRKLVA